MLIGFVGNMGSGKTLGMTILAYRMHTQKGVPVYANYHTTFSQPIKSWDEVYKIEAGLLLLDEAHVPFDSRAFADDHGRTHFILQTRKKSLTCMFTTQHISQVDKRIRNVCDVLGMCKKLGETLKIQMFDYQYDRPTKLITIRQVSRYYPLYNTNELVYNFTKSRKGWQNKRY